MREAFRLVRQVGNTVTPTAMVAVSRMPEKMVATLLWGVSRVPSLRKVGAAGPAEPRTLIDMMNAAALGNAAAARDPPLMSRRR